MTVRLVVNFILAGLAVAALVFDKNKYDKILGALLLVFAAPCRAGIRLRLYF